MLLSITNSLNLACAHSALARQPGSPHTTALVSSQGSSSSHQPLTPQERTAVHLFASVYFFIREKTLISGDVSKKKKLCRTKPSLQFGITTYANFQILLPHAKTQTMQNMVIPDTMLRLHFKSSKLKRCL